MPKGQAPAPKKPEKDFGEKLRDKMDSMRGPTERMGKRIQEAFPAISNKFKEKAAADATKGNPSARKSSPVAKPTPSARKTMPKIESASPMKKPIKQPIKPKPTSKPATKPVKKGK